MFAANGALSRSSHAPITCTLSPATRPAVGIRTRAVRNTLAERRLRPVSATAAPLSGSATQPFSSGPCRSATHPPLQPGPPPPLLFDPTDFRLLPGELSRVHRSQRPADAACCASCHSLQLQACAQACVAGQWRRDPDSYLREVLTAKVYDVVVQTPLVRAEKLSELLGSTILLKREDLQPPVRSFKLRGAYNRMVRLSQEELDRGVVTASAGNHAQGVAVAARHLGCLATVCMPLTTPHTKVLAVQALGGVVELVGQSFEDAQEQAEALAAASGRTLIAPFDDPIIIAGNGTIGYEILRQTKIDSLDAIFVSVGGGSLAAGIAAYVKAVKPCIKVIGVEPSGSNAMAQSLFRGERVSLRRVDAFADGVALKHVGAETFRICQELLDGVVLVDNAAISAAIRDVFNDTRTILEPAGALGVAGAKAYLQHAGLTGQTVAVVTSGSNIDFHDIGRVAELAGIPRPEVQQRMQRLAAEIPEEAAPLLDLLHQAASGDGDAAKADQLRSGTPPEL